MKNPAKNVQSPKLQNPVSGKHDTTNPVKVAVKHLGKKIYGK